MTAHKAAELFQRHRDELGFVNRAQCEEKDLIVKMSGGRVVGALLGNHCVQKPQSTVYEVAVAQTHRRSGIATKLVDRFQNESPHDKLVAKCPIDLPANQFYNQTGWGLEAIHDGKNRRLAEWQLQS